MKRKLALGSMFALATAALVASFATSAFALPTYTTPCSGCHGGTNVPVTATLTSSAGGQATYSVSAPGATAIAVFNGSTRSAIINAASGSFTVPTGATYTIYAVQGPSTSTGLGSTSVSPVAPPSDTVAPVTTSDAKATYVSSASIKLSATDAVGVAHTYYKLDGGAQVEGTTIAVSTAGSHTLSFWSVDAAGNVETAKSVLFTITVPDTTAPRTTSDAAANYVSSATIKLTATDAVGVAHTYYKVDNGAQVEGTIVIVSTAGSHTLTFWSVDAAGNIETATTVSFTVTVPDTAAPVTSSDAVTAYSNSATIKLSATDNVGVAHTYYKLDNAAQVEGTTIVVATAGSHTLSFWSVDAAGNIEAAKSVTFTITIPDTTAPKTTSDAKATYVSSASIKLSATDAVGVAHTYYKLDGGAQVEGATIAVSALGSHTLTFWSVDAAGNVEAATTISFTISAPAPVDTVAPVTLSDAAASYLSNATIKLSATDNVGVAHTYYKLDNAAQVEGTTISTSAIGSHTLTFWSVDAAGNIESATTVMFDVTAPVPAPDTTAPKTTSDALTTYVSSASIKLSATDAVGVAHTYYILDGAPQVEGTTIAVSAVGSHTLTFWSVDAAGNIEASTTVTFQVTAPTGILPTSLTITSRTSSGRITLSGVLAAGSAGDVVTLYVKAPGSTRWTSVSVKVTLNSSGQAVWSYRFSPTRRGTYQFQAKFMGTASEGASSSPIISKSLSPRYDD